MLSCHHCLLLSLVFPCRTTRDAVSRIVVHMRLQWGKTDLCMRAMQDNQHKHPINQCKPPPLQEQAGGSP
ncbi:hypothetical protein CGRA01v4_04909 [Colletotrichum graminicola]|nr:hypothetical protein CGRA01v4_04909 [Colletotrichum graminicola]